MRVLLACALACALSGCVVAPVPYHHGWYGPGPGWHHGGGWR